MNSQRWIGVILILIGGLMLLHQLDLFYLTGDRLIAIISLLVGVAMLRKSIDHPERKGLLGGSFFTLFALSLFIFDFSLRPFARPLFLGDLFIVLAVSNLIYFLFSGMSKSLNIFMFFFFGAIGGTMIAVYYDLIDVWELDEVVSTYWPVVLIVIGLLIIIDGMTSHRKKRLGEHKGS